MTTRSLDLDLRGKSLEEVTKILRDNGFKIAVSQSSMWDDREIFLKQRPPGWVGPPVHVVWIDVDEAHLLTVTIFNGKKITLTARHDLHLFDRPPGEPPGQDWSAIPTGMITA